MSPTETLGTLGVRVPKSWRTLDGRD